MFHALAIVCDVYFVPSLEKISEVRSTNTSWLIVFASFTLCPMPSFSVCFFDLLLKVVNNQNRFFIELATFFNCEWWNQIVVMLKCY